MPYAYFIRVTHPYESIKHIISRWALECDKMAVYEHVGTKTEKVHIHLTIEGSRIQAKQLRNIASKMTQLSFKGNESMSAPVLDTERDPWKYMTKGIHDPMYFKGYTQEFLAAAKSRYVPDKEIPKTAKQSEIKRLYEAQVCNETNDMVRSEYNCYLQDNPDTELSFVKFLKKHVWTIAFKKNGCMATPMCFTDYKTLFITYVYTHNIKLSKEDKMEKWISW